MPNHKKPHIFKDGIEYKKCPKCKRLLPATSDYFFKKLKNWDGFRNHCKECEGKRFLINDRKPREGYKICNKCGEELPATTEYFREWTKGGGLKSPCRECSSKLSKIYKINNLERCKTLENKWKKSHQGIVRAYFQKRRSLEYNTISTLTSEEWNECLEFFDYKDAYTGLPMETISQDHIIPVSKGGAYTKQNIVPCEFKVNASKNKNDMEKWYRKQSFFSENRLEKIYKWIGVKNNIQQLKII